MVCDCGVMHPMRGPQVAVNPMALTVLTNLGGPVALGIVDASVLCAR